MNLSSLVDAIIGISLFAITDMITDKITQEKYAKKCGYNCKICKNWKCHGKYCERKRKENKEN